MNQPSPLSAALGGNRRQFLLASSAAAAGALLFRGDLVTSPTGLQLLAASLGPRIPVAYIEGSAGSSSLAAALGGPRRVVPAAGVRAADSLAGRAGRVSVRGFASSTYAQQSPAFSKVLLDAHVPSPTHLDQTIPFYAFTFRRDPAVSLSSASRLRITKGRGLRVGFRLEAPDSASTQAATTVFTSRPQRELPTLQPGVYLLGLQQGMFDSASTLPAIDDSAWATLPSLVLVVEAVVGG